MQIKKLPTCERPREKLEKYGPDKLSDAELLAIVLRTGTKGLNVIELSKKILKEFPQEKLIEANVKDLKKVFGLGSTKACEIVAVLEIGRRFLKEKKSTLILSPKDVWESLKDIRDSKKEHFIIFYLDARNQVIQRETVSVGTVNANLVHPREVFEPAIKHLATQIIVAHNHPAENTSPSDEDLSTTKRLIEAGKLLGVELIDHVIVASKSYFSLKEGGFI